MITCWANCLGGCSNRISREHIVSQNLFIGDLVEVSGFPWCKTEAKKIGLSSLTAKILCTKHNSDLSELDAEAGKAFSHFREMRRLANVREKMRPRQWNIARYGVRGYLMERWFLKTLIDISFGKEYPIGRHSLNSGYPSDDLVKISFGLEPFQGLSGLYSIVYVGQKIHSKDTIAFSPLIKDEKYIAGGLFSFRGFMFLLFLGAEGPPSRLTGVKLGEEDLSLAQLNYHNKKIR